MRSFKNGIPEWPRYQQYVRGFNETDMMRRALIILYFVFGVPRIGGIPAVWTVSFGILVGIFTEESAQKWVHNVRERRRWLREIGALVTWEQVRELTKHDTTEWFLLGNTIKRGYAGWASTWEGGWDAVALYNRRTGALFAVREKIWDVVKRKGDEWRIPTHEGGEVSENEVPERLRELRGPKTRDRAKSRLGRASPGATTLVPTLVTLLDDEDDDVRGAAVGALGAIGPLAKSAVPALLRIVNASSRWRSDAARSLGLMGAAASEAVPDLVRIVLDGDSGDLRRAAVGALARMEPDADAVPAFVQIFRVPELRSEIYCAQLALAWIPIGPVALTAFDQ